MKSPFLPEIVASKACPTDRVYMIAELPGDLPGTRKLSVAALHLTVETKEEPKEKTMLKITYCANQETLESRKVVANDELLRHLENSGDPAIPVVANRDFKVWTGGDGQGCNAYLSIAGWGPVKTQNSARAVVAALAHAGKDFPSSAELDAAWSLLDEVNFLFASKESTP